MDMKKYIHAAIIVPLSVFLMSGCTWFKSYGKLRFLEREVAIQELKENWYDYTIYYAGLSIKHPSALIFDLKKDNRALVGDKWTKVEDQETLSELISSIQTLKAVYYPRVWSILGPDDQFYGYLFSAWDRVAVVIKVVDDKTMWVSDLPLPPYLYYPGAPPSNITCLKRK